MNLPSQFESQVGGNHYTKLAIQPMEYCMKNNLSSAQFNTIKYITRYIDKDGAEDIRKCIDTCMMLLEIEYGVRSKIEYELPAAPAPTAPVTPTQTARQQPEGRFKQLLRL